MASDRGAASTVDASNLVIAPGFIDLLGQSEFNVLVDGRAASKVLQGVTTEVTGEGSSIAPVNDRMIAGVAAGIANYLGADVTIIRIVLAVLTFVGGAGVPIYLACWLLIPEEGSDQSIASSFVQSRQTRSL